MKLKKITKRNYKKVCLLLWERLSNRRYVSRITEHGRESWIPFKNRHLNILGYEGCDEGCPLCKYHKESRDCPLGDCKFMTYPCVEMGHTYKKWSMWFENTKESKPKLARAFYVLLKEKLA